MKNVYKNLFESKCKEMNTLRARLDLLRDASDKDTAATKDYVTAAEQFVERLKLKDFLTFNRPLSARIKSLIVEIEADLRQVHQPVKTAAVNLVEPTASKKRKCDQD